MLYFYQSFVLIGIVILRLLFKVSQSLFISYFGIRCWLGCLVFTSLLKSTNTHVNSTPCIEFIMIL